MSLSLLMDEFHELHETVLMKIVRYRKIVFDVSIRAESLRGCSNFINGEPRAIEGFDTLTKSQLSSGGSFNRPMARDEASPFPPQYHAQIDSNHSPRNSRPKIRDPRNDDGLLSHPLQ